MKLMKHVKKRSLDNNQFDRFKNLEISPDLIFELSSLAKKNSIHFSLSIFDHLYPKVFSKYIDFFKIASGDLNYYPLLREIKKMNKFVILSTGMSNSKKISNSIKLLDKKKLVLLHCISSYPTKNINYNLNSINYLKKLYGVRVGLSDHTFGSKCALMSLPLGVRIIEKHFLPNKNMTNAGDFELSLNTKQFKDFRNELDEAIIILGKERRSIFLHEKPFFKTLTRSLYFKNNKNIDSKIELNDISFLRPYNNKGVPIEDYKKIIGKKINKNIFKNQLISYKQFKKN